MGCPPSPAKVPMIPENNPAILTLTKFGSYKTKNGATSRTYPRPINDCIKAPNITNNAIIRKDKYSIFKPDTRQSKF